MNGCVVYPQSHAADIGAAMLAKHDEAVPRG
jgi:hypothetical protein